MNNEEVTWDNLSPYNKMMIKVSLATFLKEQQLDILCRGTFGAGDFIACEEFLDEVGEYVWDYYQDKLMDEF